MSKTGWLDSFFRRLSKHVLIVPAIVAGIMICGVIVVWQYVRTDQEYRLLLDTRSNLDHFAARLESHITTRMQVGQHLRREWEQGHILDSTDFIAEAYSAHHLFGDFQAINWVDKDGVVKWVTPFEGNQSAIGLRLREHPDVHAIFAAAERTGESQTSQPIILRQNGGGFVSYIPIIREEGVLGYINLVFRTAPIIQSALNEGLLDSYQLIVTDGDIEMYNSANVPPIADYAESRRITIGNREWLVTIAPTRSMLLAKSNFSDELVLIGGILSSLAVGFFLFLAMAYQRKRRASETIFRTFIEHSPSAILIKDAKGRYLHANEVWHKWFNPERDDITGKHVNDLFPDEHAETVNMQERDALQAMQAIETEIMSPLGDGTVIPTLLQKFPILDENGKLFAIGGVNMDIRASKETESNLRQALIRSEEANHSKSKFLATMSHELRTPLNAIIGFSDIMIGEYFGKIGNSKYVEYSKDIHSSGKHLLALIDEVLDISAIELGKRDLVLEPLVLTGILEDCVKSVKARAIARHVNLEMDADSDLPPVFVDSTAVKQIFLNLLTNAIKFTQPGDKISLAASTTHDCVIVTVADTGQGIAAEHLATITEPFVKGQNTSLIADEGVGLGLSIVKSLLDAQKGHMTIDSKLDEGTTITIHFPKISRKKAA
jgi:PAS domain S-box-containing protein